MITWIEYIPSEPPETDENCLVTDGKNVDLAWFGKYFDDDPDEWNLPNIRRIKRVKDITHYAYINLPISKKEATPNE